MLRPLPMARVELHCLTEDLPHAALALAETNIFNPEAVKSKQLPEVPGKEFRATFREARLRLDKIRDHYAFKTLPAPTATRLIDQAGLDSLNGQLAGLWAECSSWQERKRRLDERLKGVQHLRTTLQNFSQLDIELGVLRKDRRFLNLLVGTVPGENVNRLRDALGIVQHVLDVFLVKEHLAYVVIAGIRTSARTRQVKGVLHTAGFHTLHLPEEFEDRPGRIQAKLEKRNRKMQRALAQLEGLRREARERVWEEVLAAEHALQMAEPYAELSSLVAARGGLALVDGWIPQHREELVRERLRENLPHAWVLESRAPRREEWPETPAVMRQPWMLQSFGVLVRKFGIPRYGEADPTIFFALTFLLMFGMMFGDVGHGALIAAAGLFLHRQLGQFASFFVLAGSVSTLFGFLYGSVFGYEHVLPALWLSPMEDPILLLSIAAWLGVVFITLTTLMNVANHTTAGDWAGALLDGGGVAGLLLYFSMVLLTTALAIGVQLNPFAVSWVLMVPLASIALYKWTQAEGSPSERALVTLIETFETVMNYVSGTLSFLRVAAFGLNHAALAITVFTLAGMLGSFGHWLTVVLGNLFILILEGAIVTIQVIRLEYYEGFSRFFVGQGRRFRPLRMQLAALPRRRLAATAAA